MVSTTNSLNLRKIFLPEMKNNWTKLIIISGLVLLAAFSRLIPHPNNFTAIGALAIFGAFSIPNRWLSASLPLVAMWVSDLVINNVIYATPQSSFVWFSEGFIWIYLGVLSHSFASWVAVSNVKAINIASSSLWGAIAFFILSNFGVWAGSSMYPPTFNGLAACFVAAIPFFGNVLVSNLFFSLVLFGTYFLLEKKTNIIQPA